MDVLLRIYRSHRSYPPVVYLLLFLILFGWFIWTAVKEIRFLRRARYCTELIVGEVSSLAEVPHGRGRSFFAPNIKYRYIGRSGYETTDFYEAEHTYPYSEYAVGMEVHLFIDPEDGSNVYLAGEKKQAWERILIPLGILLIIILALGIAALL